MAGTSFGNRLEALWPQDFSASRMSSGPVGLSQSLQETSKVNMYFHKLLRLTFQQHIHQTMVD